MSPTYDKIKHKHKAFEKEAATRRLAEDDYRTIFNAVNDAIMIHDAETGRPLATNPKMAELLGYRTDEIIYMQVADWSVGDPERVQKKALQKIKATALGTPQLFEWRARTKDDKQIWIEVSLKSATIGGEKRVLAVVRDITSRKKVETALRDSEQQFRDLVESTSDWVWEVDRKGLYIYSSPKVKEVIGYQPEEVIGKTPFDFMSPQEANRVADIFTHIISKQEKFDALENTNLHKNGTPVVLETSGVPVFNAQGDWMGFRGIDRDITERKMAERERDELLAQLHHARKMESIGTLAGGVAHDFNNLLFMIIGNAELVLEDLPDWNPMFDNMKEIKDAGLRAAGIVKQLLNFSHKAAPEMKPINAIAVIAEALQFLRSTIPATIKIRADLPDDNLVILADPTQINQLVMNICINASQAMEMTGGIIDVRADRVAVTTDSVNDRMRLTPGNYIKITIGDNGPGIEQDISGRIFNPYFTTKAMGERSGMGLAVVHGIITSHNGSITVDSQPGKGAVFTILIPLDTQEEIKSVPEQGQVPGGRETILFIDDEAAIVKMAKRMLAQLGYHVDTCMNPVEALERFRIKCDEIDLVITDMTMPEMTGDKLAEALMKIKPEIPVILCTGFNRSISDEAAQKIGIRSFVYKPVVKADLAMTIRQVLDHA